MGRRYTGDIRGKFWFAVQDSDDASFFGGTESQPNYIEYYFTEDDLPTLQSGIGECKRTLGGDLKKLRAFFKDRDFCNEEQVAECLGIDMKMHNDYKTAVHDKLQWYARLLLGNKILACVKKKGECTFEAELC